MDEESKFIRYAKNVAFTLFLVFFILLPATAVFLQMIGLTE